MGAPRDLGRPNCSGLPSPADPLLPGQTVSKLFDTLFVVLDALFVAYFRSSFFNGIFYLPRKPLGLDFKLSNCPPTLENVDFTIGILTFLTFIA